MAAPYDVAVDGERRSSTQDRRSRLRRFGDWRDHLVFLGEIVGLGVVGVSAGVWVLTLMGLRLFGPGTDIPKLEARVAVIEESNQPLMYMTCILFAESHPQQVPKKCDEVIRAAPGK